MNSESASDYASEFDAAERCVRRGEFTAALRILEDLLAKPLPAQDRRVIWVNIAIVNDEMLRVDDALRAYDEAIIVERSIQGYWLSGRRPPISPRSIEVRRAAPSSRTCSCEAISSKEIAK